MGPWFSIGLLYNFDPPTGDRDRNHASVNSTCKYNTPNVTHVVGVPTRDNFLSLSFVPSLCPSRTTYRHYRYNSISSQFNYEADDVTTSELQAVETLGFPRIDGTNVNRRNRNEERGKKKRERDRMLYARQKLGSLASHLLSAVKIRIYLRL